MNTDTKANNEINDKITEVVGIISNKIKGKGALDIKNSIDIIIRLKNIYDNKPDYEIDIEPYEIWHNEEYKSDKIKERIQTSINNINNTMEMEMEIKKNNIDSLIIDITKLHIIEYNKLSPEQKIKYIPTI
jgi:hypothetical protein